MTGEYPQEPTSLLPSPPVQNSEEKGGRFPWRYALILFSFTLLGNFLRIPYELEQWRLRIDQEAVLCWNPAELSLSMESKDGGIIFGPGEILTDALISLVAIVVGLTLGPPLGLARSPMTSFGPDPNSARFRLGTTLLLSTALGVTGAVLGPLGAALATVSARTAAIDESIQIVQPVWWAAILMSVSAGIREEVWLRLGMMTLIVWGLTKLVGRRLSGDVLVWSGIILASLLFGMLHMPLARQIVGLSGPIIVIVLVGNGIIGLIFGWLYWRKGLFAAMTAHITQDIVNHVLCPLLGL